MLVFSVCDTCNCIDIPDLANADAEPLEPGKFLCSECRAIIQNGERLPGKWHNHFEKTQYDPENDIVANRSNPGGITME